MLCNLNNVILGEQHTNIGRKRRTVMASLSARASIVVSIVGMTCVFASALRGAEALRVHEWGTFTALQNEKGEALPGINIDDEPLPAFCHNLYPWALQSASHGSSIRMKAAPARHPYVTLRLETPVLYFHPAAGEAMPFAVDVSVSFRGGWLTEFYPHAEPDEPGLSRNAFNFGPITPATVGSLSWRGVQVGTEGPGPETAEHVWLAPRDVRAASVTVPAQTSKDHEPENERFLFYRGVGNRTVPLRVSDDVAGGMLSLRGQCADVLRHGQSMRVPAIWLVHIRRDGTLAFRALDPLTLTDDTRSVLITTSSRFPEAEYSAGRLEELKAKMHAALLPEGLYDDEATAMLNTWNRAYFQSPGLRLFFLVPRVWTDAVLPLKLSRPAELERVMMGRIELISAEQRQLLAKLAATPVSNPVWLDTIPASPNAVKFREGRSDFGDLGVPIPADYQTYLDLGRFRNALLLAEQRVRPAPHLQEFINAYELSAYVPE